jgi:hypothetical protein
MLYVHLLFVLLSLYEQVAEQRELSSSIEKICGGRSLSYKLIESEGYWKRSKTEYYSSCKFIHARYNCTRFSSTSSTDYRIAFDVSAAYPCIVPNTFAMMEKLLENQIEPVNMIFLGDSHIMQLYQSILCMFQSKAQDIDTYQSSSDSSDAYEKVVYQSYSDADECHAIKYKDYDNYFLAKPSKSSGRCQLSHAPGEIACFKLPIDEAIDTRNDRRHSQICSSYTRPYVGNAAVSAGLDLSSAGLSLHDIDVIFVNSYISASSLGDYLMSMKYKGKVYALPRFPEAPQIGYKYSVDSISGGIDQTQRTQLQLEVESFCYIVNKIMKQPGNELQGKICRYLDYTELASQRSADAKASIYPLNYRDHKNRVRICQENATSSSSCIGKDFRVCSSDAYPCDVDGHFCLPGPSDELGLLVLTAALSYYDYSYHGR